MKTLKVLLLASLAVNLVLGWFLWKNQMTRPVMVQQEVTAPFQPVDLQAKYPPPAPTLDASETAGAPTLLGRPEEIDVVKARMEAAKRQLDFTIGKARLINVEEDGSIEFRNAELRQKRYDYQTPPHIPWEKFDVYGVDRGLYVTPKDAGF